MYKTHAGENWEEKEKALVYNQKTWIGIFPCVILSRLRILSLPL